jgi:hypothetical protein
MLIQTQNKTTTNSGFIPQANYTDRATAASCRRILMPNLADGGCRVVSATNPHGPFISVFYTGVAISLKELLNYPHEAEWTPFQTHYFSENLVASGIEPGTSGSVARNSDH